MDKLSQIKTIMLQKRYEINSAAEILYEESKTRVIVAEYRLKFEILLGETAKYRPFFGYAATTSMVEGK